MKRSAAGVLGAGAIALAAVGAVDPARAAEPGAPACEALAQEFSRDDVALAAASYIEAADAAPAHCDVRGAIGGNVKFAVMLPTEWSGRFVMVGNGGKAGELELEDALAQAARGNASATTDTGHDNTVDGQSGAKFGSDPEMEKDFGDRAVHETAGTAKALVEAYYGAPSDRSYWLGCSTGGRQGLMKAQRHPDDFDGYVIGAPVYNYTGQQMTAPALLRPLYASDPYKDEPVVSAEKAMLLGSLVYEACDAADGLEDGLIADPLVCDFSAERDLPLCEAGVDCFSPAEIDAISAIYAGVTGPDGEVLVPGLPVGSENIPGGWTAWLVAKPGAPRPPFPLLHTVMFDAFNHLMFEPDRPDFGYFAEFDFASDPALMEGAAEIFNATDPDLRDVAAGGAKIILYHGWGDPGANPVNTLNYYKAVEAELAQGGDAPEIGSFMKLYMVPGMAHCRGGVGHDKVDWLTALQAWVEEDEAPEGIIGARASDGATRPHCPYPQQAVYAGSGDETSAESYTCERP